MRLYSYWRSSSAWRVRIVLAWKGLPYEYVAVNLSPELTEQRSTQYAAVNAFQQVPTLEWMDRGVLVRLAQSVAIAEYIEELHPEPPLLPRDGLARARVRQAVEIVNSGIQPHQNSATIAALRRVTGEPDVAAYLSDKITRGLVALEEAARMHGQRFSVGHEPTLADVFLVPQLYNARRFEVDLLPYPRLTEIEQRAAELPAFVQAHPECQPDAPKAGGSP